MLARHLERCAACGTFAASVAAFTKELRSTPLVAPEARTCDGFETARRRQSAVGRLQRPSRPRSLRMPIAAVTAAVASMVVTSVVLHNQSVDEVSTRPLGALVVYAADADDDSATWRTLRNLSHERQLESDVSLSRRPGVLAG